MSTERLNELTAEMTKLSVQMSKADGMTKPERQSLSLQALNLCSELESDYGVIAFKPEVPNETQKMFFTLAKLVFKNATGGA